MHGSKNAASKDLTPILNGFWKKGPYITSFMPPFIHNFGWYIWLIAVHASSSTSWLVALPKCSKIDRSTAHDFTAFCNISVIHIGPDSMISGARSRDSKNNLLLHVCVKFNVRRWKAWSFFSCVIIWIGNNTFLALCIERRIEMKSWRVKNKDLSMIS